MESSKKTAKFKIKELIHKDIWHSLDENHQREFGSRMATILKNTPFIISEIQNLTKIVLQEICIFEGWKPSYYSKIKKHIDNFFKKFNCKSIVIIKVKPDGSNHNVYTFEYE